MRWRWWPRSEEMKLRRRDLASGNLLWEKREERRARREGISVWVRVWVGLRWERAQVKNERRVRGREARVSEARMEWRRGGVRWGMTGESEAREGLSEVSTEMTV